MVRNKILVLMATFFLTLACQPQGETIPPTPEETASLPTVTAPPTATPIPVSLLDVDEGDLNGVQITVWHAWFGAPASLFDLQVAEFNEQNPWGITVSASAHGNYYLLYNEVAAALDAGAPPDVVVALSEELPVWDEAGALAELTPYISDPIWGFSKADLSDFPSVFLEQEKIAGRWLGLPAQRTARFIVYNRTWASELGFDAPPLSFDDFREQACAANQAMRADESAENDGKGGWIVDDHSLSVLSWMRAFGGGPLSGDEYRFLIPENIEAFKALKELYDADCAWVSTEDTPYEQFANRSALFATASMEEFSDLTSAFIQQGSADEWTPIAFPGAVQNSFVTYGSSYALLATDDIQQLASWLFVRWALAPENQARWVKSTALFPLRISSLDELADYQDGHPQWADSVDLIAQAQIQPQATSWRQVRPILGDGFAHIFRVNTQAGSVSAILAEMGSTVSEMIR